MTMCYYSQINTFTLFYVFRSILGNSTSQSNELLPILLQACEDGLVSFVRAILDHDVDVSIFLSEVLA